MEQPLHILRRNWRELSRQSGALAVLTDGQLAELARLTDAASAAQRFRAVCAEPLASASFARLCRLMLAGETDAAPYFPESVSTEPPPNARTAYLRNAYADRAFAAFSQKIDRLAAQYASSFSAACEEVYYDRCSYCILPLQSTEDGLLTSFTRMIAKYDLKIALVTDVPMQDGDATMRYTLLKRGMETRIPETGYLQATFVLPRKIPCGAFLAACEACGASLDRVTTVPLHYTSDLASLTVCFRVDRSSAAPLLLFLRETLESYTPDGLFASV